MKKIDEYEEENDTESDKERAERKDMYLSRVSAYAMMADNYDEIMKEANEQFEKENPI